MFVIVAICICLIVILLNNGDESRNDNQRTFHSSTMDINGRPLLPKGVTYCSNEEIEELELNDKFPNITITKIK